MTTFAWPTDGSLPIAELQLMKSDNTFMFTSVLSGDISTLSVPGARWGWGVSFGEHPYSVRAKIEAFLARLNGSEHRVSMFDVARPVPTGTISLSGITAGTGAQFVESIALSGCGAGATLKAGDWLRLTLSNGLTQLVMCAADASADGSGNMTMEFRPALRWAVTAASAVVVDKPTGLFIMREPKFASPRSGASKANGFAIELHEVFEP